MVILMLEMDCLLGLPACCYHMAKQSYLNAKGGSRKYHALLFPDTCTAHFYGLEDN